MNPEWFVGHLDDGPLAIWKSKSAKMEIAELAMGIYLAKVMWTPMGRLMEYDEILGLAGQVFGLTFENSREFKRCVFKRTKDLVVFLTRLIFLIERAQDEKDARK